VLHLSGELDGERARAERATLPPHLAVRYHPFPYLHEEMGAAFASADLAVCRAGASTLGELPLFGLPAILVPYPYAWRYQKVNADYLALRGAAIVVEDERLGEVLLPTVESLLVSPTRLETMAAASRDLARPGAARAIADELERLASGSAVHG
jgi:UDP-N-acetylglucosamine--N-acetylmuramyl-(pentapeptide) pyrophosphoryl-undecaprenol N-acetylglucosamine transferase